MKPRCKSCLSKRNCVGFKAIHIFHNKNDYDMALNSLDKYCNLYEKRGKTKPKVRSGKKMSRTKNKIEFPEFDLRKDFELDTLNRINKLIRYERGETTE